MKNTNILYNKPLINNISKIINENYFKISNIKNLSNIIDNAFKNKIKIGDLLFFDKSKNTKYELFNFNGIGEYIGTCCITADLINDNEYRFASDEPWDSETCAFGYNGIYTYWDENNKYAFKKEILNNNPDLDEESDEFYDLLQDASDKEFESEYPGYLDLLLKHFKEGLNDIDGERNTNELADENISKLCVNVRGYSLYLPWHYNGRNPEWYIPAIYELYLAMKNIPEIFLNDDEPSEYFVSSTMKSDNDIYYCVVDDYVTRNLHIKDLKNIDYCSKEETFAVKPFIIIPKDILINAALNKK